MKEQDRKNLSRGWPFYLFCLLLIGLVYLVYRLNPNRPKNEPLGTSIARNLTGQSKEYAHLDDVINDRSTWEPILADWIDKPLPDLSFTDPAGTEHHLSDFSDQPVIVVLFSTWYAPSRMQIQILKNFLETIESEQKPIILALCAESAERLQKLQAQSVSTILYGSVTTLPEPLSLVQEVPSLFFLKPPNQLALAATGLLPTKHIQAIFEMALIFQVPDNPSGAPAGTVKCCGP